MASNSLPLSNGANPCGNNTLEVKSPTQNGGTCSTDGKVTYNYTPKTLGTQSITVTANGVSKPLTISVTPYLKVDPTVTGEERTPANQCFGSEISATNCGIPAGYTRQHIGTITLTSGDEPIQLNRISAVSSVNGINVSYYGASCNSSAGAENITGSTVSVLTSSCLVSANNQQIMVFIDAPQQPGNYTFAVTAMPETFGQYSGMTRTVQGLPITFHYTVQ